MESYGVQECLVKMSLFKIQRDEERVSVIPAFVGLGGKPTMF